MKNILSMKKNKGQILGLLKGFTLIEVLVVVSITLILLGFSLSSFLGAQKTSRDNKRKADLESIRSALEIYRSDCQAYPLSWTLSSQTVLTGCGSGTTVYMSNVPKDPGSNSYNYFYISANSYCLCAKLEMSNPGSACGDSSCNYSVSNP